MRVRLGSLLSSRALLSVLLLLLQLVLLTLDHHAAFIRRLSEPCLTMGVIDILLGGAVLGSTAFCVLLFLLPTQYRGESAQTGPRAASPLPRRPDNVPPDGAEAKPFKTSIQIVVLGDIGRSPRMQYHAMSAGKRGACVHLIGYRGISIPSRHQSPARVVFFFFFWGGGKALPVSLQYRG